MQCYALTGMKLWPLTLSASWTWLLWLASISSSWGMSASGFSQSQVTFRHKAKDHVVIGWCWWRGSAGLHGTLQLWFVTLVCSLSGFFAEACVLSFSVLMRCLVLHLHCLVLLEAKCLTVVFSPLKMALTLVSILIVAIPVAYCYPTAFQDLEELGSKYHLNKGFHDPSWIT